jgi:hypothetical protein
MSSQQKHKSNVFILLFSKINTSTDSPVTPLKARANATSPPHINLATAATKPKPQQYKMSYYRLVPVFINADHIGNVKGVLHHLGIEMFSTADGHHKNLGHPVSQPPKPKLQDDTSHASLYGCSINQYTHDRDILTDQSFELNNVTSILSHFSMLMNSPCEHSYLAKSAMAPFSGTSLPASPLKKKYYIIAVGKCVGIYYNEWYAHAILFLPLLH